MGDFTRFKLIRDDLPPHTDVSEVRLRKWATSSIPAATRRLLELALIAKLHEETTEIAETPHNVSEYADLVEVAYMLAGLNGITPTEIERERQRKSVERGGFDKMRMIVEDRRGPNSKPTLDELLEMARHHRMTPEEIEAQRQSWVRGEMGMGSDADEARARADLEKGVDKPRSYV